MNLESRRYTISFIVLIIGAIYLIRLFFLQVVNSDLKNKATMLTEKEEIIYPSRGIIFDRNGKVLVTNQTVYDLMVTPTETLPMDTAAFCELTKVSKDEFIKFFKRIEARKERRLRHVFIEQITPPEFARISEELYKYPGFFAETRTLRVYPQSIGALLLGDVGKISKGEQEASPYYTKRDYIGKGGIEKAYEAELRGKRGVKYVYRDNQGVVRGVAEGKLDSAAVAGQNLFSTIDSDLQRYGEELMANKRGCIVAIEPKTGEVLCLVSAPTYDPNLLVGRARGHNFNVLLNDPALPLFNRATQAEYRPGSIFKLAQSLTALQVGAINPQTRIHCNRGIIGCHGSHSFDDLEMAIVHSCNPYFREVMHRVVEGDRDKTSRFKDARIGLGIWQKQMQKLGLGSNLGSDIPGVKTGLVPGVEFYDDEDWYGELQWAYSTIYSLSIGEGEMQVTPLQMCNLVCTIANRGYFISPHTVKSLGQTGRPRPEYLERNLTGIDTAHFRTVINAMEKVVGPGGTANSSKLKNIVICGKTGTVQNVPPKKDHAVYVCFAPKDDPKIAIAVYTENAGFGGTWSAPIASLLIEKYLTDTITEKAREKRMLEADFLDE
ncbi:MAG: penicillin-binding transpeptidase domain-containing protein [Flavobacteriales bacterium]|nr:penicillin-binding transpeptidase domain-containing protein [Flavobacteriales bacterium]